MTLSSFLKSIIYFSLAIIPALAWYVSDSTFFPFITGKNFAFRFLIEISFVAWIILAVHEPAFRPKKSLVFYSYTAFLAVICLANLFGTNAYFSFFGNYERMEGWFTHLHLFVYFTILYSVYKTSEDWARMWGWFMVGSIAVSSQAIMQLFGQKEFYLIKLLGTKGETFASFVNQVYPTNMGNALRIDSTLGNSEYYGIYTLFFIFISLMLAVKANKWDFKFWRKTSKQNYFATAMVLISAFVILLERFMLVIANSLLASNPTTAKSIALVSQAVWYLGIIMLIYFGYNFVKKLVAGEIGSVPLSIFAGLNVILLLFTQQRGSYIGFIGGVFIAILVFVLSDEARKKYKKVTKYLLGTLLAFFVAAGILFALKDTAAMQNSVILKRIQTIKLTNIALHPINSFNMIRDEKNNYRELVNYFGEATIVSRFLNAKMSIQGVSKSFKTLFLGYGQENYGVVFAANYDPRMYEQEVWFDRAHDVFMDWLVAGGILGLVAYLALYLTPLYMMWFGSGKKNIQIGEKALITGALAAYFIHNIFVFDNLISYIIFIAILAYVASLTRVHDNKIENSHKLENNKYIIYGGVAVGTLIAITLFLKTVLFPLMTNLDIISTLRNAPNSYSEIASTTNKNLATFKSAIERNSFGTVEANEQMIQQVSRLAGIDLGQMQGQEKIDAATAVNNLKTFSENSFENLIKEKATARNASYYGSYLRMTNQYAKSLNYLTIAHNLAERKQLISFEYVAMLAANNRNAEALEVAKQTYENETTFANAKTLYDNINDFINSTKASTTKSVIKKK